MSSDSAASPSAFNSKLANWFHKESDNLSNSITTNSSNHVINHRIVKKSPVKVIHPSDVRKIKNESPGTVIIDTERTITPISYDNRMNNLLDTLNINKDTLLSTNCSIDIDSNSYISTNVPTNETITSSNKSTMPFNSKIMNSPDEIVIPNATPLDILDSETDFELTDVLLPINITNNIKLNEDVSNVYTIDNEDIYMSVATPIDSQTVDTTDDIIHSNISSSKQHYNLLDKSKNIFVKTINKKLYGEIEKEQAVNYSIKHEIKFPYKVYLPYDIIKRNDSYDISITTNQPKLNNSTKSPQGSLPNPLVITNICVDYSYIQQLGTLLSTPAWDDISQSSNCTICQSTYALLRKPHHCRNCGKVICNLCSNKNYSITNLPFTYYCDNNSQHVRVCDICMYLTIYLTSCLYHGYYDTAKAIININHINIYYPITNILNNGLVMHPIHLAAYSGNVQLVRWLIEEKQVPIYEDKRLYGKIDSNISNNQIPLKTSEGLTVFGIATKCGHVDLMRYLVQAMHVKVTELTDITLLQIALHSALEAPGSLPIHPTNSLAMNLFNDSTIQDNNNNLIQDASLITSNPESNFLIEAEACISEIGHSYNVGFRSSDGHTINRLKSSILSSHLVKQINESAIEIIETEIQKQIEFSSPSNVNNLLSNALSIGAITLPYNDNDIMAYTEENLLRPIDRPIDRSIDREDHSDNSRDSKKGKTIVVGYGSKHKKHSTNHLDKVSDISIDRHVDRHEDGHAERYSNESQSSRQNIRRHSNNSPSLPLTRNIRGIHSDQSSGIALNTLGNLRSSSHDS